MAVVVGHSTLAQVVLPVWHSVKSVPMVNVELRVPQVGIVILGHVAVVAAVDCTEVSAVGI